MLEMKGENSDGAIHETLAASPDFQFDEPLPEQSVIRSTVFGYGLALLCCAVTFLLAAAFTFYDVKLNLTIFVVVALIIPAWYGGRGPGLLAGFILQGAMILSRPIPSLDGNIGQYVFGQASIFAFDVFLVMLVSSRRSGERKLLDSEERYRHLFENNPFPMWVYDLETLKFLAVNDKAVERYGYSPEEFLAMTIKDIRPPEEIPLLLEYVREGYDTKSVRAVRHRHKNGALMNVEISGQPIFFSGRRAKLMLAADVTERKRVEAEAQVISELIQGVSTTSNLDELLVHTHQSLKKVLKAENCFVALYDKTTRLCTMRFFVDQYDQAPPPFELNRLNFTGYVFRTERPVLINQEVFKELSKQGEVDLHGSPPACWIGAPLRTPTEIIGVLVVQHYEDKNAYDQRDLDLLTSVGDQIAVAIERKRAEDAMRESEYKMRTLLASMSEGLLQVDNDDYIHFANNCFCEMVDYTEEELIGAHASIILLEEELELVREVNERRKKGISDRYELRLVKKNGEILWTIVGGAPLLNAKGEVVGSMGTFTDITERKRAEQQLLHDAFHDGLTGLANRTLFMDHLRMTIERGKRKIGDTFAVLFLDFDRFKIINDSLGHAEGDNLLKQIAQRLEDSLRSGDLVARLGGDEFTVLLNELDDESDALVIAERIQNNIKAPFNLSGREIFTSASIGIALSTIGHATADEMLRDADIAMYRAKAKGKAQYQVFDQAMHKQALNQLQIETEMRHALDRGEFCVHYQPIMHLQADKLVGYEALVRWEHPERGMISPMEFIPAAEETGLILPLGRWILRESCLQLRRWQLQNSLPPDVTVSVNLSGKQFMQYDLAQQVAEILEETKLAPACLKLEITESYILGNTEMAISIMKRLRALGVELSLDDFGTGYSSLSYLHSLPIDYLKIDRSFVSHMAESPEKAEIVSTIIKLAQNLKMKVVAEGIETAEQVTLLKDLNCEYGQGYFFSAPFKPSALAVTVCPHTKVSV